MKLPVDIGQMPVGWEVKTIGEVTIIVNGGTPKSDQSEYWNGDIFWITPKDMGKLEEIYVSNTSRKISQAGLQKSSAKLIPENSVILSTRAPIGHLAINQVAMATNQGCRGLVPKLDLDTKFLFYFLKLNVQLLNELGIGTTFRELSTNALAGVKMPIPPLSEQKRIVAIFDEVFEGIDRAIANTEKNLANSHAIFESYLNAIFTQKGEGWVEKKLEDICKEITVGHVGSMASKYKDSGIPFLRSQNILPFRIKLDNVVFIDNEFHSALKKSQLRPGDLAIVRTGYPGTAAVIPEEIGIVNCSDLVIVKPCENINPHYLCLFFNSILGKTLVGSRLVGAAQKHFNITTAKKVLIPFPYLREQNRLVTKMDELATETQRLETIYRQKIAALNELKQSILQKAFTGELTADTANQTTKAANEGIAA